MASLDLPLEIMLPDAPQIWTERNETIYWNGDAIHYVANNPIVRLVFKRTERNVSVMWVISARTSLVRAYPQLFKYYLALHSVTVRVTSSHVCEICSQSGNVSLCYDTNIVNSCDKCTQDIASIRESAMEVGDIAPTGAHPTTYMVVCGGVIDVVAQQDNIVYFFHRVSLPISDFHYPNIIQCNKTPRCYLCTTLEEICGKFAMSTGRKMFIDANWKKVRLCRELCRDDGCDDAHNGLSSDIIALIIRVFIQCMSG